MRAKPPVEATQPPLEEAVVARTRRPRRILRLAVVLPIFIGMCGTAPGHADNDWKVEELLSRFTYFNQAGFGYQSQAGPGPKGFEGLHVWNPAVYLRVRQNEKVEHTIVAPVDIITSASTDALDAITSASRTNETLTIDITTRYEETNDDTMSFRYGAHVEEWFHSVFAGVGYEKELAQDNATIALTFNGSFDVFIPYGPDGKREPPGNERDQRGAFNANLEVSQILSRTTLVKGAYGLTWQAGELITPWNSVPFLCNPEVTACLGRLQERFPSTRIRNAFSGLLAQHIPVTHSTLRLHYRFYFDDFDVRAHTMKVELYQYATPRAYIRASYRAHHQNAVYFWTSHINLGEFDPSAPRTADSDLAEFWAHEVGGKLMIYVDPAASVHRVDVGFSRYWRTNDLTVDILSLGYGRLF